MITKKLSSEKIENFGNAVEFLLIKALFDKLWSLIFSNWKIISNCILPALLFAREVLIDYVSNMIRMRLNNCTIFWKQRDFLHGLDNLQNRFPVGTILTFIFSFFANENFSRDREFMLRHFLGYLLKAKTLVSGNR